MLAHMHTYSRVCTALLRIKHSMYMRDFSSFLCLFLSSSASVSLSHKHTPRVRHSRTQACFHMADSRILLVKSFHSFPGMFGAVISRQLSSHITQNPHLTSFLFCNNGPGLGNKLRELQKVQQCRVHAVGAHRYVLGSVWFTLWLVAFVFSACWGKCSIQITARCEFRKACHVGNLKCSHKICIFFHLKTRYFHLKNPNHFCCTVSLT